MNGGFGGGTRLRVDKQSDKVAKGALKLAQQNLGFAFEPSGLS